MNTEERLIEETNKWLEKIEKERRLIELKDKTNENFLKNIDAYISDSKHFLETKDYIEAFEAVIWAWAHIELGEESGILKRNNISQKEKPE